MRRVAGERRRCEQTGFDDDRDLRSTGQSSGLAPLIILPTLIKAGLASDLFSKRVTETGVRAAINALARVSGYAIKPARRQAS